MKESAFCILIGIEVFLTLFSLNCWKVSHILYGIVFSFIFWYFPVFSMAILGRSGTQPQSHSSPARVVINLLRTVALYWSDIWGLALAAAALQLIKRSAALLRV